MSNNMSNMSNVSTASVSIALSSSCCCCCGVAAVHLQVVGDVVCDRVVVLHEGKVYGDITAVSITVGPHVRPSFPCPRLNPATSIRLLVPETPNVFFVSGVSVS